MATEQIFKWVITVALLMTLPAILLSLVIIALLVRKCWRKDAENSKHHSFFLILIVAMACHCCTLSIIDAHVLPERLAQTEWALFFIEENKNCMYYRLPDWLENMFAYVGNWAWLLTLWTYALMAINRYIAITRPLSFGQAFNVSTTLRWLFLGAILALLCSLMPIFGVCCRDVYHLHGHLSDFENDHTNQREHTYDEKVHEEENDFNVMVLLVILCNVVMVVVTGIFHIRCHKRLRQLAKETTSHGGEKERARVQRAMWRQAVTQTISYTAFIVFSMPLVVGADSQALRSTVALLYAATATVAPLSALKFQRQLRVELYQMLCGHKMPQVLALTTKAQSVYSINVRSSAK